MSIKIAVIGANPANVEEIKAVVTASLCGDMEIVTATVDNFQHLLAAHNDMVVCLVNRRAEMETAFGADKVIALNKMIKDYAQKNNITYVDYHSALKDEKNGLPKEIAEDGIHPNKSGYEKMEAILMKTLK